MRVVRLEIFGFKSFLERLVLPLGEGITGVVGPNGCGKSNVVDAIRWVLGETRASQLRGGTLEDVIFNGTDKLRPLGLAEVTITLRASGEDILSDLLIVSDDIEMIESDEPIAVSSDAEAAVAVKPGLRVISGSLSEENQTGDYLNEDRQSDEIDAEEASATVESTNEEARNSAAKDQGRFAWLKSVSEVQITRRLYRSGESEFFINRVQSRLKDIKELLRLVGLGPRAYTIVAQGEVSRIVTAKPEERRMILEDAAGILGFRDKIAEATRRLAETNTNITRLTDVITELSRQVASLKRQAMRARNRQELKAEVATLEASLFVDSLAQFEERASSLGVNSEGRMEEEIAAEAALTEISAQEQNCRGELLGLDSNSDEIRSEIDKIKEKINSHARAVAERRSKVSEAKALLQARESEIKRLEERRAVLEERKVELGKEISELEVQESSVAEEMKQHDAGSEDELQKISAQLQNLRETAREKEKVLREARDNVVATESRLRSVQDQLIAASPITQLNRSLKSEIVSSLASQTKLFVDGLTVPEKYGRAVQAILGERATFLVSSTPFEVAKSFISERAKRGDKVEQGIGIGIFMSGEQKFMTTTTSIPFPSALSIIGVSSEFARAAQGVFQNVYFIDTLDAGVEFLEKIEHSEAQLPDSLTLVTLEGDILSPISFYSLRHEGGLIQLKTKERSLQENLGMFQVNHQGIARET